MNDASRKARFAKLNKMSNSSLQKIRNDTSKKLGRLPLDNKNNELWEKTQWDFSRSHKILDTRKANK
jgi:hypothetical protein